MEYGGQASERSFSTAFRVGRDAACEVRVEAGLVSREHLEVALEDGHWWARDLGSTNGTYLDGEKIERLRLKRAATLQLGQDGPLLHVTVEAADAFSDAPFSDAPFDASAGLASASPPARAQTSPDAAPDLTARGREPSSQESSFETDHPLPASSAPGPSVSRYIARYFEPSAEGEPAGEHTQMLRRAYARVEQKQRQTYAAIIAAVAIVLVCVAGFATFQYMENQRLKARATEDFYTIRQMDKTIAQMLSVIEAEGKGPLAEQLQRMEAQRRALEASYDGLVRELGLYRTLSEEERAVYKMARIFGESEFEIPAGFVREVRRVIRTYWQEEGRARLVRAVDRAQDKDYVSFIVQTMQEHGLPPEFFYLALQESNFEADAVGPFTRWGIAKGMWQFIPSTARRYGLTVGPRADRRAVDPQDDRHDPRKATEGAARYLQYIYSTPAQASGLLVIASYNWGEHRVAGKLERLSGPQSIPDEALDGLAADPQTRSYWRFLGEYHDRMPEETKDYVLKVFAAAVIGENPRLFGFDFDNPLAPYTEVSGRLARETALRSEGRSTPN